MAKLYLIPTTLSNNINANALLTYQLEQIKHIKHFIVETPKVARMHLKQLNLTVQLQELNIQELNKYNQNIIELIQPLLDGNDMGLISDCGLPAIADPGSLVVREVHKHNIDVVPLVGPSSLMLALMASGVNGQSFAFNGYLPIDINQRKQKIIELQGLVTKHNQSQIVIETPFRNQHLLEVLLTTLNHNIILCIAVNLMQDSEQILSYKVSNWHTIYKNHLPIINKKEVVFVIGCN